MVPDPAGQVPFFIVAHAGLIELPDEVGALGRRVSQAWIVVPAFNEAARIGATLQGLCAYASDVVVVDDGSTDGTGDVAAGYPVTILRHPINCGQGTALRTGIAFALERGADVIVTFDADGQHDPTEIAALVAPVLRGEVDVVIGSRFLGRSVGMPRARRAMLKAARVFTRASSGLRVTDPHSGLRAFSQAAAHRISFLHDGMAHASELIEQIAVHRLRCCEVPVTVHYTPATLAKGQSNWSALSIIGHLLAGRVIK